MPISLDLTPGTAIGLIPRNIHRLKLDSTDAHRHRLAYALCSLVLTRRLELLFPWMLNRVLLLDHCPIGQPPFRNDIRRGISG